jgi:hypothetical protein
VSFLADTNYQTQHPIKLPIQITIIQFGSLHPQY